MSDSLRIEMLRVTMPPSCLAAAGKQWPNLDELAGFGG